jgi:hypothetical protein
VVKDLDIVGRGLWMRDKGITVRLRK